MFKIVSIIPGIETGAPDLTESKRGSSPPKDFSSIFSTFTTFVLIFFFKETEREPFFR